MHLYWSLVSLKLCDGVTTLAFSFRWEKYLSWGGGCNQICWFPAAYCIVDFIIYCKGFWFPEVRISHVLFFTSNPNFWAFEQSWRLALSGSPLGFLVLSHVETFEPICCMRSCSGYSFEPCPA